MQNSPCLDLLSINHVYAFWQTMTICTCLSDWHKLVLLVLKLKLLIDITNNSTLPMPTFFDNAVPVKLEINTKSSWEKVMSASLEGYKTTLPISFLRNTFVSISQDWDFMVSAPPIHEGGGLKNFKQFLKKGAERILYFRKEELDDFTDKINFT